MFVFSKEWREGGGEGGRKETSMGQTQGGGEEERIEECKGVSPPPVSWGEGEVKGMHRARQVGSIRVDRSPSIQCEATEFKMHGRVGRGTGRDDRVEGGMEWETEMSRGWSHNKALL